MLDPSKIDPDIRRKALAARTDAPLDPVNLFNITWRDASGQVSHMVLPKALTGVEAEIVVIYGKDFPTGSHKVGATYSVLIEQLVRGAVKAGEHTVVWPSTGNYGIGGAWVGGRMGFDSVVVLPEEMSAERFEMIRSYGSRIIATPGCESNVKEIYDKCHELSGGDPDKIRIMNQFERFGNYRFHSCVTGPTIISLMEELAAKGVGRGKASAFVSAMGSAGTIGAGDALKERWPDHKIVGLEPIQCPTLFLNGHGGHDIQGIGDKHVTWIHNVMNMDAMICVDDMECKLGLQLLVEEAGRKVLEAAGLTSGQAGKLASITGISGVCNILGAIKTANHYGFGKDDVVVTVCTDNIARYHSVLKNLTQDRGVMDASEAGHRLTSIFHGQKQDWIQEGTRESRLRWHNLKYFTWVEQQGKTVAELDALKSQDFWAGQRAFVSETDRLIEIYRKG
jgi:cysteine synthase